MIIGPLFLSGFQFPDGLFIGQLVSLCIPSALETPVDCEFPTGHAPGDAFWRFPRAPEYRCPFGGYLPTWRWFNGLSRGILRNFAIGVVFVPSLATFECGLSIFFWFLEDLFGLKRCRSALELSFLSVSTDGHPSRWCSLQGFWLFSCQERAGQTIFGLFIAFVCQWSAPSAFFGCLLRSLHEIFCPSWWFFRRESAAELIFISELETADRICVCFQRGNGFHLQM